MDKRKRGKVFATGKAKWLLQNVDKLEEDERALLLAIIELEKSEGRQLTPEEEQAVEKLTTQIAKNDSYAPTEIAAAVEQMRTAQAVHPVEEWPSGIYKKIKQKKKSS